MFRVWGLGFGVWVEVVTVWGAGLSSLRTQTVGTMQVWGLWFGVWGFGFGFWGLRFGVWGLSSWFC